MRHTLLDHAKNQEYAQRVEPVLAQIGGEVIGAGVSAETVEGNLELPRLTLDRFPSMERLRARYDSPEYAPLKRLRQESSRGDLIIFEGS